MSDQVRQHPSGVVPRHPPQPAVVAGAPRVLMCGTGEYTTGFVGGGSSPSDKKVRCGRGLVARELSMVGTTDRHDAIRAHFARNLEARYTDFDASYVGFPQGGEPDPLAYRAAIDRLSPGDAVTVFTPDDTHYDIALYALQRRIHVLVTKPAVKLLSHHLHLARVAREQGVLCMVEYHKRWDPAYSDARDRARNELGLPQYFYSYMSQPKLQLRTFRSWAGKSSDISYYLGSHHVDVFEWICRGRAVPRRVVASASQGIAHSDEFGCQEGTEDTITLMVDVTCLEGDDAGSARGQDSGAAAAAAAASATRKEMPGKRATAVFTASWAAPTGSGVHSEQGFHYVGTKGEVRINQARRGYTVVREEGGQGQSSDVNPFYMKYSPDAEGRFDGQTGYGYRSLETFVVACGRINRGERSAASYGGGELPTLVDTVVTTAVLEAGRRSLDSGRCVYIRGQGMGVKIVEDQ